MSRMFAMAMWMSIPPPVGNGLDAQALQEERPTLLENGVEALMRSTQVETLALRSAESLLPAQHEAARVAERGGLYGANGMLPSQRRRKVSWALRPFGRVESAGVYDAGGQAGSRPQSRCMGVG